jgi:predicted DNA-binding protein
MKVRLDLLIEESEKELLESYCKATGRTKTDVLRELIRKLKPPSATLKGGA